MELSTWLLFIAVSLLATASPGPAILLAVSNSIRYGMKNVLLSSFGNVCGLFILSAAAILGLGAILKTSTSLFLIVKLVGAAYLIYLGIRQWRSKKSFFDSEPKNGTTLAKSDKRFFTEGFLIALTNPKAILFFTALFPQFISTQTEVIPQFLIMTTTLMLMSFLALVSYGLLASKVKRCFSTEKRSRWFNRILGGLFASIGVGLLQLRLEK